MYKVSISNGFRQQGLTLVELMVALVMGLVLLAGVAAIFVANKETYRLQEALARSQENGRFALSTIARDLQSSGYKGCRSTPPSLTEWSAPPIDVVGLAGLNGIPTNSEFSKFDRPIFAFEGTSGTWSPSLDSHFLNLGTAARPVGVNDVLMVRAFSGNETRVTLHNASGDDITVADPSSFSGGQVVAMISNCSGAAVFPVSGTSGSIVQHDQDLKRTFQVTPQLRGSGAPPGAGQTSESEEIVLHTQLQRVQNRAYYVAPSQADPANRRSLWRWDGVNNPEELVEGVERLEVELGVDTTPTVGDFLEVDAYQTAAEVQTGNRWNQVVSARITLVLSSQERGVTAGRQSLDVNLDGTIGDDEEWEDGRLRQVYGTTASLRNRQ
jgi:type IV pilus assembly protein PilW